MPMHIAHIETSQNACARVTVHMFSYWKTFGIKVCQHVLAQIFFIEILLKAYYVLAHNKLRGLVALTAGQITSGLL